MENIEKEIWNKIPGYDGIYEVSNYGRIKRLSRVINEHVNKKRVLPEIILKQHLDSDGYLVIKLTNNLKSKNYFIHRLVAISFLPNKENKPQVNHKDGIKNNCNISNLEWCTLSENRIHAYSTGLQKGAVGEKQYNSKLKEYEVLEIRKIGKNKTLEEIASIYNVNFRTISNVLNRKTWKHI